MLHPQRIILKMGTDTNLTLTTAETITKQNEKSGERAQKQDDQESKPVLFKHPGEFTQKAVSLVFIDMIQAPSATVVGLHLHLKTLAQKARTAQV